MPENKLLVIGDQQFAIGTRADGQLRQRDVYAAAQAMAAAFGEPFSPQDPRHFNQVMLALEGRDQFALRNVPVTPTPPARELPTKPPMRTHATAQPQPSYIQDVSMLNISQPSNAAPIHAGSIEAFISQHSHAVTRGLDAVHQIEAKGFSHQKEPKGYPVIGKWGPKALWDREGLYISVPRFLRGPLTHRITHSDIATGKATIKVPKRTMEGVQQQLNQDWMGSIRIGLPIREGVSITIRGVEKPMSTVNDIIHRAKDIFEAQAAQIELQALIVRRPETMQALLQLERNVPISRLLHERL